MDDKNGKNPFLALTAATMLFAALGVMVYTQAPFKPARPPVPPLHEPTEQIRARLWQDPFQAVLDQEKPGEEKGEAESKGKNKDAADKKKLSPGKKAKPPPRAADKKKPSPQEPAKPFLRAAGVIDFQASCELTGDLRAEIDERITRGGTVTVLGAMVFGGPYAELVEFRLRQRYAVLAALNRLHYYPHDAEHIGYLRILRKDKRNDQLSLSNIVPFEWLTKEKQKENQKEIQDQKQQGKKDESILLLWLNEDSFTASKAPLATIACLKRHFHFTKNNLQFKLIGPPSSTTLIAMLKEIDDDKLEKNNNLAGLELYCATATADDPFLLPDFYNEDKEITGQRWKARELIAGKFALKNITFYRTIGSDGLLVDELIEELRRRGVDLLSTKAKVHDHKKKPTAKGYDLYGGHQQHIVLLSEWDTHYGRLLPRTFLEVLKEKHNKILEKEKSGTDSPQYLSNAEDIKWVHRFSYLRGIDGKLPGEANDAKEQKKNDAGGKEDRDIKNLEEPAGKSQYDYLRRLAERVDRLDDQLQGEDKGSIKAIGVLGNDYYDKFLVLQALGQRFPDRIFFTTDLDANYFHPANIEWTRNLVVASSFGLQLCDHLQGDVPPFRDSYATSAFWATLNAFGKDPDNPIKTLHKNYVSFPLKPRIFEIGRSNAIDLSVEDKGQESAYKPVNQGPPLQSVLHRYWSGLLFFIGFFLLLFIMLVWLSCHWTRETGLFKAIKEFFTNKNTKVSLVSIIVIVLSIVFVKYVVLMNSSEEPFLLTEGISVWPTEFIRLFAIILSCVFFYFSIIKLNKNEEDIYRDFCLDKSCEKSSPTRWSWLISLGNLIDVNKELKRYFHDSKLSKRLVWILPVAVVYWFICVLIITSFELPTSPVRGSLSKRIDLGILFTTIYLFLFLTFFVLDAIMLCRRFIGQFVNKQPHWPPHSLNAFAQKWIKDPALPPWIRGKAEEALSNWMLIQLVARRTEVVGKLIFYPFIVWFLMFVARLHYFDNWHTPLGLAIVISLSPLLAWSCAVYLRRSAEKLRTTVIDRLSEQLAGVNAADPGNKADADRIHHVLKEVTDIKTGAFASYLQQPVLQSLLVPLGGISGLKVLEFLANLG